MHARVLELVDRHVWGACDHRRGSSSLLSRTKTVVSCKAYDGVFYPRGGKRLSARRINSCAAAVLDRKTRFPTGKAVKFVQLSRAWELTRQGRHDKIYFHNAWIWPARIPPFTVFIIASARPRCKRHGEINNNNSGRIKRWQHRTNKKGCEEP